MLKGRALPGDCFAEKGIEQQAFLPAEAVFGIRTPRRRLVLFRGV